MFHCIYFLVCVLVMYLIFSLDWKHIKEQGMQYLPLMFAITAFMFSELVYWVCKLIYNWLWID